MAEPKIIDFNPRWMHHLSDDERYILEGTPLTGSLPEVAPRINLRVIPATGLTRLTAKTLSETIELTQDIVQYAGSDVYHGINPDFADLRSLKTEIQQLTLLMIEPFEEGSFVIPARLVGAALETGEADPRRKVSTADVVNRFDKILAVAQHQETAAEVSIGALQVVEGLGRVIRREAAAIEFTSFNMVGQQLSSIVVDTEYVGRVSHVLQSRQPTRAGLETLEGTLTALDLVRATMQLSLDGRKGRVQGTYPMRFQPTLIECLSKRIRIQGRVERMGGRTRSVQVLSVEALEEEA